MKPASALNCRDRVELKSVLESQVYDLLIIGGGITGAGVARDAALRGLKVALIEGQDFASGTSSRSSKMIHGGLRYLAKGDIAVVKESASERAILHAIAPHLAQRSDYIIATRSWKESLLMRIALQVYEFLGKVAPGDRHQAWSVARLRQKEPGLATDGVNGAVVYPEYLTDDARLTLATIRSAKAAGAVVMNYMKAVEIGRDDAFRIGCESQLPEDETQVSVRATLVVNTAGPWVDHVCRLENSAQPPRLALSRGIHVVVDRERLPVNHTVVMSTPDKRKIFAVPAGEFTYLGTTDEFYPHDHYWPDVYQADLDYLFETTNQQFPQAHLSTKDVVSVWSGVRPLVGSTSEKATEVSRKDEMWVGPMGMLSVGGGKLSAYRAMAERIVDKAIEQAGFQASPCRTASEYLPGGEPLDTTSLAAELSDRTLARWQRLYGSELPLVARHGKDLEAEVNFAVEVEGALRLEDYWARRSSRAWFDHRAGLDSLAVAADLMASKLQWSDERRQHEIDNCVRIDQDSRQHFSHTE